jgi:hypothetical protein
VYDRDIIIVKSTKHEVNQLFDQLCTKFHVRILGPSTCNEGLFSLSQVNPTLVVENGFSLFDKGLKSRDFDQRHDIDEELLPNFIIAVIRRFYKT